MNFEEEIKKRTEYIESVLRRYLPSAGGPQKEIMEAMEYSVLAGGKRLRPMLLKEIYNLMGGKSAAVEPFMAAIEMIHTYSLVHDDLPAMDDDEYRRGRKTTHVVYGEALGILAGDALLNYAFELLSEAVVNNEDTKDIKACAKAMNILAKKTGIYGMLGGQVIDISMTGKIPDRHTLDVIYALKTGALIESGMMAGAILAGAQEEQVELVREIAAAVGMAFQIRDDILDVEGSLETIGKPVLSDEKNHKTTYVTLSGLENAKKEVERLSSEALEKLDILSQDNEFMKQLITQLIYREK